MLFFGTWLFIMNHLSSEKEEISVQIISIITTIFLLYIWIISSISFSPILNRIIDKNERKYIKYLKQKYANASDRDLYDGMLENSSLEQPFPMIPEWHNERIENKRKMHKEYSDVLKIRKLDENLNYLKRNAPVWIGIAIFFFCLGCVW